MQGTVYFNKRELIVDKYDTPLSPNANTEYYFKIGPF